MGLRAEAKKLELVRMRVTHRPQLAKVFPSEHSLSHLVRVYLTSYELGSCHAADGAYSDNAQLLPDAESYLGSTAT
eukprot:540298-Amphidinium_carterae.1